MAYWLQAVTWYSVLERCEEKLSVNSEAAEEVVEIFSTILTKDENLNPEQMYNADETLLFWCYLPKQTLVTRDESGP